jgi:hypothetical protein
MEAASRIEGDILNSGGFVIGILKRRNKGLVKRKYRPCEDEFWGDITDIFLGGSVLDPMFSFESSSSGVGVWDRALVVLCERKWDL